MSAEIENTTSHESDFKFLFRKINLENLYRIEQILQKAIMETEHVLGLNLLDKAKIKHEALNSKISKPKNQKK